MNKDKLKNLLGLVDADEKIYRVGFATKEGEPLEYALQMLKTSLEELSMMFHSIKVYLTGSNNFRKEVAVTKGYKENRKDAPKPPYYEEMREYLVSVWGAEVIDGREADDAIGEAQSVAERNTTCIVGQDKDFKTIPGWHYNPVKQEVFYVDEKKAILFFLFQLITGDRVDNIPGVPGYGEKKAKKIILDCNGNIERIKDQIKRLYVEAYGKTWREVLHEQATLLFIHREPGKTYQDYVGGF